MPEEEKPAWTVIVIGGGAAVGKTTVAKAVAAHYHAAILPVDTVWVALQAFTSPASHPELQDPAAAELTLPTEQLCERHISGAEAISQALDPVIEYYRWERWSAVLEGVWITPAAAARWARRFASLRAVFIHEPDVEEVLSAMLTRSGRRRATRRKQVLSKVCWLFGNWVRDQAEAEGLSVVEARPRATLAERVLAAIDPG